jgi:hypothetical protein
VAGSFWTLQVVDLIRAGVLEELPGRRSTCEITAASLDAWLAGKSSALQDTVQIP